MLWRFKKLLKDRPFAIWQGDLWASDFIDGDHNVGLLIANSITELIANFANDLDKGLYSLNEEALEDEQHFLEADAQIDIANWHKIEKWKGYVNWGYAQHWSFQTILK